MALTTFVVLVIGMLLVAPAEAVVAHLCPTTPSHPRWRTGFFVIGIPVVFALLAVAAGRSVVLAPSLVGSLGMLALAAADITCGRIPNRIVYSTAGGSILAMLAVSAADGSWSLLGGALVAAVLGSAFVGVIHLVRPDGMGMGDVRLAALVGLMAGWTGSWYVAALLALLVGFAAGSIAGIGKMLVRRTGMRTQIRFGPYLVLGALVVMLWRPHAI